MNDLIYDDLDNLINEYKDSEDFKRLLYLKKLIDEKYKDEIASFKMIEEKYQEALKYKDYYPNFDSLKLELSNAKNTLYSFDEVKEYKKLENKISNELIELSNDLASAMSNKFNLKTVIK